MSFFVFLLGFIFWGLSKIFDGSSSFTDHSSNDDDLFSSGGGSSWSNSSSKGSSSKSGFNDSDFESDSFWDSHGDEHIMDDEGYCEDCDEYHEED